VSDALPPFAPAPVWSEGEEIVYGSSWFKPVHPEC
jgi:hypothetical protein